MTSIYRIATHGDWEQALRDGEYTMSTRWWTSARSSPAPDSEFRFAAG
jgi:hypothetical protein